MKNLSDKRCRENQNTYFMFKNFIQNSYFFLTWTKILDPEREREWGGGEREREGEGKGDHV
jgi:hypothetical protein